jgi:hypothetical protein
LNTVAFGIPKAIGKKIIESAGYQYPEIENKATKTAGEILGLIAPGKVAVSLANKIPGLAGRGLMKAVTRGTLEGSAIGFTTSPEEFTNLEQRIKQSAIGAFTGGAVAGAGNLGSSAFRNIQRVGTKSKQFAERVRQSLFESKQAIGDKFEGQLNSLIEKNPNSVINLESTFNRLKDIAKDNSRVVSDLKMGAKKLGLDSDLVEGFINNPSSASKMTLEQTRQLRRAINNVPSIKSNLKKGKFGNYSETDIDLIDFSDEIKQQQLGTFPELAEINQSYGDSINKYNLIKDKFRTGKLLDNIKKNFGDKEVQSIVKELLPDEIIREMGGYRKALATLNAMKWVGVVGASSAVAAGIGRKLFYGGMFGGRD